jgi:DNA-binding transcriptional LysR family regulator
LGDTNFLKLQYFLAAAKELNFTKAAAKLYISQQALSAHIASLEKELRVELFTRTPVFKLTYAGKLMEESAKKILEIRRQLNNDIDQVIGLARGELRVGISYTRGQALLPYILPQYHPRYPLIEITLKEGSSEILSELLRQGEIDLVISTDPKLRAVAETIPLIEESILLTVPNRFLTSSFGDYAEDARKSFHNGVRLAGFRDCPFIMLKRGDRVRAALDEAFAAEGITPNILLETDNIQTAISLSVLGLGLTAVPEMFLQSVFIRHTADVEASVTRFPLAGNNAETLYVGYPRYTKPSPAASAFIARLRVFFEKGDWLV